MQKINKSTKSRKTNKLPIGTLILVFFATAIVVLAILYVFVATDNHGEISNTTTEIQKPTPEKTPAKTPEVEETDNKTPVQNEGEDPNAAAEITGSIISTNIDGYTLRIRTNIDQYITGTCTLDMRYTGENATLQTEYNEVVNISDLVSTSTCEGFDIDIAPLESGAYTLEIQLTSTDNRNGVIKGEVVLP